MPQRIYVGNGQSFLATDKYAAVDNKRCQRYLDKESCFSSGCNFDPSNRRCRTATAPLEGATPMMQQCANIGPRSHGGQWGAICRAAHCRTDKMVCVPKLRLVPRDPARPRRRARRRRAAATHATNTPRIFIRDPHTNHVRESILIEIKQDHNTGAQQYTVQYTDVNPEAVVITQDQIKGVEWNLYGRLRLRALPNIIGEDDCSKHKRRMMYGQAHSTEEVQRCLARLCRKQTHTENPFCIYSENQAQSIPPGGIDAVVKGMGKILSDYCSENALQQEICNIYSSYTKACNVNTAGDAEHEKDNCTESIVAVPEAEREISRGAPAQEALAQEALAQEALAQEARAQEAPVTDVDTGAREEEDETKTHTAECKDIKDEDACVLKTECEWQVGRSFLSSACAPRGTRSRFTTREVRNSSTIAEKKREDEIKALRTIAEKKREDERKALQKRQRLLKEKEKRMIDCKFTTEAGCIGSKMARQHCVFDNKVASSKCKPRAKAIAGDAGCCLTKEDARKVASRELYTPWGSYYDERKELCDKAGGLWEDGGTRRGGTCT